MVIIHILNTFSWNFPFLISSCFVVSSIFLPLNFLFVVDATCPINHLKCPSNNAKGPLQHIGSLSDIDSSILELLFCLDFSEMHFLWEDFKNKPKMAYSRDHSKMVVMDYHGLSWTIMESYRLSWTIQVYLRLLKITIISY